VLHCAWYVVMRWASRAGIMLPPALHNLFILFVFSFVCLFVGIKPEKLYTASCVPVGGK